MRPRLALLFIAAPLFFATPNAAAQASKVSTARELAITGIDAVEAGDCTRGLPLLERAEALYHATVHLQYLARCHVQNGRYVQATEMWRQITREGAPTGASPAVRAAVTEAAQRLPEYLPKLATTVIVTAEKYDGIAVTLDGAPIPSEMLNAPHMLDPGDHELAATAPGYGAWSHQWSIGEGERDEVTIELDAAAAGGAGDVTADAATGETKGFPLSTVGWVTGAVGAAALLGGTVTMLTRNSQRDKLEKNCPNGECPESEYPGTKLEDDKASIESLTTMSNVLLIGGGVVLATGVTLIVIGSSQGAESTPTARLGIAPEVGGASLGFSGRF